MKCGLIGENLKTSFSKSIHEMFDVYSYDLIEIKRGELDEFLKETDLDGFNVTMPYKQEIMDYIEVDDIAGEIGAVNTVYKKDGKFYGTNTDVTGFETLLTFADIHIDNARILVLGTGGASNAVKYVCRNKGCEAIVASRTPVEECVGYDNLPLDVDYIVNCTPVYAYSLGDKPLIDLGQFKNLKAVIDINYNPCRTFLIMDATKLGIKAVSGLMMLIAQATKAAEYFSGNNYSEYNEDIYTTVKRTKFNIVLIGMPGAGKSFVAQRIAQLTNREYIDIDREIECKFNKSVADIFNEYGEEGFRDMETFLIEKAIKLEGCVIATGGGAVLSDYNVDLLKSTGVLIEIDRDIACIDKNGRPLLEGKNEEEIISFLNARKARYEEVRDFVVFNKEGNEFIHQTAVESILLAETYFKKI